jgi:hypothetical protein
VVGGVWTRDEGLDALLSHVVVRIEWKKTAG